MDSLKKIDGRSLRVLVRRLEQKKEQRWTSMGGQSKDTDATVNLEVTKTEGSDVTVKSLGKAKNQRRVGLAVR